MLNEREERFDFLHISVKSCFSKFVVAIYFINRLRKQHISPMKLLSRMNSRFCLDIPRKLVQAFELYCIIMLLANYRQRYTAGQK